MDMRRQWPWGEFSLRRVALGRVVFGASCPVSVITAMDVRSGI